jgi:hypothetical protein
MTAIPAAPVICYGRESLFLALRKDIRSNVFENEKFRIFGAENKGHNEQLHNRYVLLGQPVKT